jgi:hypothetical protein
MTDKQQLDRFGEAVEEKKQRAKEASERPQGVPDAGSPVQGGEQEPLVDPAHEQDDRSARAKNTRHRQVTAENWNQ